MQYCTIGIPCYVQLHQVASQDILNNERTVQYRVSTGLRYVIMLPPETGVIVTGVIF